MTTPTPMQTLLLWALLARGGAAPQKGLQPALTKPDREALVRLGLVQAQRGARNAVLVEVTDRGWAWAAAHMAAALPTRSTAGVVVLADLLARLGGHLAARDLALADMLHPPPAPAAAEAAPPDLPARVRAAYLAATGGAVNRQVRLAALRAGLPGIARADVDATLLALEQAGGAGLLPLDDPTEITPADHEAALRVAGRPRHLLWLDR